MKALSLTQPWATLVAIGAKHIETRSWSSSFRGRIAIHASKGFPKHARDFCQTNVVSNACVKHQGHWSTISCLSEAGVARQNEIYRSYGRDEMWPLGAIVAVAEITGCFQTPSEGSAWIERYGGFRLPPPEPERSFGDYSPNRFAWRFGNIRQLTTPIPCKGALGLWNVPADVVEQINAQVPTW